LIKNLCFLKVGNFVSSSFILRFNKETENLSLMPTPNSSSIKAHVTINVLISWGLLVIWYTCLNKAIPKRSVHLIPSWEAVMPLVCPGKPNSNRYIQSNTKTQFISNGWIVSDCLTRFLRKTWWIRNQPDSEVVTVITDGSDQIFLLDLAASHFHVPLQSAHNGTVDVFLPKKFQDLRAFKLSVVLTHRQGRLQSRAGPGPPFFRGLQNS